MFLILQVIINVHHTLITLTSSIQPYVILAYMNESYMYSSAIHIVYMYIILFNLYDDFAKSSSITPYFKDG